MSASPVFDGSDGRFVASEFARGPWDRGAQHGGAPAALLMRAFEALPGADGLVLARVTYEFLRPAPIGPVSVEADMVRAGRRVQLLEGAMAAGGVEVVRARALRVQRARGGGGGGNDERTGDASAGGGGRLADPSEGWPTELADPSQGRPMDRELPFRPMFAADAMEIRFVNGNWGNSPCAAWFRLRRPLVAGETPSSLQQLAAAGDFGNGISATLDWDDYLFINPDLTLYVERQPVGEWICLESETRIALDGGIGLAESVLYDSRGRVGRATQALLVAPR